MLTILLKILSILGIILLVILGLLLLIILLVLFVPVFYKIKVNKNDKRDISVSANWLLGFLRVQFLYPEPGTVTAKVLFFKIFDSRAKDSEVEDSAAEGASAKKIKKEGKKKSETTRAESAESSAEKAVQADRGAENAAQTADTVKNTADSSHKTGPQEETAKQNPIEKLQYTFRNICDKIKDIRDKTTYYKEILLCEDTKGLLNHAFMRLGKILKSIRPRKLKADVRFGTGSPDTTGYAYAIYGILCPHLGRQVLLTPDFEQAILEGNIYAAGHITVFKLLWHVLMVVLDKKLWKLISKFKQED